MADEQSPVPDPSAPGPTPAEGQRPAAETGSTDDRPPPEAEAPAPGPPAADAEAGAPAPAAATSGDVAADAGAPEELPSTPPAETADPDGAGPGSEATPPTTPPGAPDAGGHAGAGGEVADADGQGTATAEGHDGGEHDTATAETPAERHEPAAAAALGEDQRREATGEHQDAAAETPQEGQRNRRGGRPRRGGRGRAGGRRRFQWDDVFLKQRLDLLRAMEVDDEAVGWAVGQAGPVVVAEILAGEGSSGREFGRRAFQATPETDDQAAWIVLAAVRAREILPVARRAVSLIEDPREQVAAAVAQVGTAKVNAAMQGQEGVQQVFAARARRVEDDSEDAASVRRAWALLALARVPEVKDAVSPREARGGGRRGRDGAPGGGRDGGPTGGRDDRGGRGDRGREGGPGRGGREGGPGRGGRDRGDRRERRGRREPSLPGGSYSAGGASSIGSQLALKLQQALDTGSGEAAGGQSGDRAAPEAPRKLSARERALQRLDEMPGVGSDDG